MSDNEFMFFTDGSALSNPGPTGGRVGIYLDCYGTNPVLLKKKRCQPH